MSGDTTVIPPGSAPGLLLVDDEAGILAALRRVFRPHGYRIFTAGSGAEGLALLGREAIDVVVSDMRMPEMDGAAFLEQVRQQWPHAGRILLTGHADVESTVAAINRGEIWRYIAKPWNDDEIVATVQDAVDRVRLAAELARLDALTRRQNEELKSLNAGLEQKVAERTAQLAATLASLQQAHGDLKETFLESVRVLSGLAELRGGQAGAAFVGHGRRVAESARALAQRSSMDEAAVQQVMLAGLLHDIGKIGLPDALLDKPFVSLSGASRALVMKHPVIAENLLLGMPQITKSALAIRHHHECFDGSGYPDGIKGEAIPLAARILAVANDYDALQLGTLTPRRLGETEALAYLLDNRGRRYDPVVVDLFAQWLAEVRRETRQDVPLPSTELRPGMVLARDFKHRDGYLLLAAGHRLEALTIAHLCKMEQDEGQAVVVYVRRETN